MFEPVKSELREILFRAIVLYLLFRLNQLMNIVFTERAKAEKGSRMRYSLRDCNLIKSIIKFPKMKIDIKNNRLQIMEFNKQRCKIDSAFFKSLGSIIDISNPNVPTAPMMEYKLI